MSARRSYGTGSLDIRADKQNREVWYGRWRSNGRQVQRAIGPKRAPGGRDGLTRGQAEAQLRRMMSTGQTGQGRRVLMTVVKTEDVCRALVVLLEANGLLAKSIHNYVGTLSALFNYARNPRRRWVSSNPCDGVELPGVPESDEIRFLDESEWEAVLRHVQTGPYESIDRAFYLTAVMAGLRHGELIALRWRDVDWLAGRVRVRQNWVLGEFDTPKSRRGSRSVPMADRLAGEFDRLYKRMGEPDEDEFVFPDPITGEPLDKAANLRRYRKVLKAASLDPTHNLHGLRHTMGTRMAGAGVPMRTLQEWMGHRDLSTTERYADYAPSVHEAGSSR